MRINHNITALNTHRQLITNTASQSKSIEKLSSGQRINRAGDDAAGLAISEKMRAQIRGLNQASSNAQDGISMIQTTEGALNETHDILQRMRELAAQAANDTNATTDREEIQKEINQLTSEVNRISNTTEFNSKKLLNGGPGTARTGTLTQTNTPYQSVGKTGTDLLDLSGGTATGGISNLFTKTPSVTAGTVGISQVDTLKNSQLASNAGTIGSPLTEITASSKPGTADINKAIITVGTNAATTFTGDVTNIEKGINAATDNNTVAANVTITKATGAKTELIIDVSNALTGMTNGQESSISIGGKEYTFTAGATAGDSATNLLTALKADAEDGTGGMTGVNKAGITLNGTSITFTSTAADADIVIGTVSTADNATDIASKIKDGGSVNTNKFTIDFASAFSGKSSGDTTSVSIGGREYEFTIGSDDKATATALAAAINADKLANGGSYTNFATAAASGTDAKITFTSTANTDEITIGTYTTNSATTSDTEIQNAIKTDGKAAVYNYELKENFTAGDSITIGGKTYTATATGKATGPNEFEVGVNTETTRDNLLNVLQHTVDSTKYGVTGGSPSWNGDTNSITITAKNTGVDANAADYSTNVTVTKTAEVKGQYKFEIASNFSVGQKIDINGQKFEARASGNNDATGFVIGSDINATAKNLLAAIEVNSTLSGKFDAVNLSTGKNTAGNSVIGITGTGFETDLDTIVIQEKKASGDSMANVVGTAINVENQVAVKGEYSFEVNKNFSAGDHIDINGVRYTATSGTVTGNQFNVVDGDISKTVENLVAAINGNTTETFSAVRTDSAFFSDNKIVLTEKVASGKTIPPTVNPGNMASVAGQYEFLITNSMTDGDVLQFDGYKILAGNSAGLTGFAVSAGDTTADTAKAIADAINNATTSSTADLQALKGKYAVAVDATDRNKLIFTEKTTSGDTVTDLQIGKNKDDRLDGAPKKQAYEFTAVALDAGSTVKIGDATITLANKGTAAMVAAELKSQIDSATTGDLAQLKANYEVTVDGDKLTLTKKTVGADSTPLAASFETTDYNGYKAKLQIGANTGQSMTISINDMRSVALKISGDNTERGATTTSRDGKAVASYVNTANVTNGSNDDAVEFALDVSTSEKASAAISLINDAIEVVSAERSKLGAFQNRLEHTINNMNTSSENLTAAESRIRDVDMAKEMMAQTKSSILAQATQAMLAQANQQPQGVLQLLR